MVRSPVGRSGDKVAMRKAGARQFPRVRENGREALKTCHRVGEVLVGRLDALLHLARRHGERCGVAGGLTDEDFRLGLAN